MRLCEAQPNAIYPSTKIVAVVRKMLLHLFISLFHFFLSHPSVYPVSMQLKAHQSSSVSQ